MDNPREEPQVPQGKGKITVKVVIKRRDGTVEDLGIVSEGFLEDWGTSLDQCQQEE